MLEKFKIHPKKKYRMNIMLCQQISMPIVWPTFLIDVLKMEQMFQMGYKEGKKLIFVSLTNW